jgi:hypothetical protein
MYCFSVHCCFFKSCSLLSHDACVLYGCGAWSVTLREEHRRRAFENRVLRKVLGPKSDEVRGQWRRLHNEELCALYSSPNIIQVIK